MPTPGPTNTLVHPNPGGEDFVVDSGGEIVIASGGLVSVNSGGSLNVNTGGVINYKNSTTTGAATIAAAVMFTQTAGAGTYTGTITLPAGVQIIDIGLMGIELWTGTTASAIVGDTLDDDGFFIATNLVAIDLLKGEANTIEHPGGKAGVYIAVEQRQLYSAGTRNVICKVVTTGTGTAGRTRFYCVYSDVNPANATKA
jgi:hypothetical protein